jgi:hypothetical protein
MRLLLSFLTLPLVVLSFYAPAPLRAQEELRAAWQVTRFDVSASLLPAERALTARAVLTVQNVGRGAGSSLTVRINPKAEIKAVRFNDSPATFTSQPEPRGNLQRVIIRLPGAVAPNGTAQVAVEYRLPVAENSGLASISPLGSQFLPLSSWYPSPNTLFAVRGADTAPLRLTVSGAVGEAVISTGKAAGQTFEQTLNAQPFFITGNYEQVAGAGESAGVTVWLPRGWGADERKQAETLARLAGAARSFYASFLGAAPDAPVNLVAVTRGSGFNMAGTVLLDSAAFRRPKVDSAAALLIAESVARLWLGGETPVRGEGYGVIREGLARHLANLFLEKQYGRETAEAERIRQRVAYAGVARRDPPLSVSTPLDSTYYTSTANKGAMVWRLADRALGHEAFLASLRQALQSAKGSANGLTLPGVRAVLAERGGAGVKAILDQELDKPTDMDLMVGLPQQRAGQWVSALRNLGSIDAAVQVAATTERGERVVADVTVPARNFGEAVFKTASRIVRVEIDPDKLYPQLDYTNDVVPHARLSEDALAEATRLFATQQYAQAETIASELVTLAPRMQEAHVLRGRALLGLNRLDEAEKEFRSALDVPLPSPATLAWANVGLGEIALRKGQAADAARRFNEAVRADAEYASTLAARAGRVSAESKAGAPAPVDEAARAFITQLDQTIKSGKKAELEAAIVPGELARFVQGIVGSQPELWQTRVLRTEQLDASRLAADVSISAKELGREQAGTAVLVLARVGGGWKLEAVEFFEVR